MSFNFNSGGCYLFIGAEKKNTSVDATMISRKDIISVFILFIVARKMYIALYLWPDKDGPYMKIDQNELDITRSMVYKEHFKFL